MHPAGREWLVEQRYRAVLEVLDGAPVTEVALRYGVARQSVYTWKAKYAAAGLEGLKEHSRRPGTTPTKISAEVEALICKLRRSHPRWGARRIEYELGRNGCPDKVPSRVTVHRVLTRNGLVRAQAQQHRRKYKRWQREAPMHLWQLDLVGGVFLAAGRECKLLTCIDDHSRFAIMAKVLTVPSGRAVADAFVEAMRVYGVPSEVLTDNGKQFTGRFTKPRPAEVLFERVCRENGITARLTKPYSPTTTGKVERLHKTLRHELLDIVGPFPDLASAQAAIDAWLYAYNHSRPHQALDMATPASLFRPNQSGPIGVIAPDAAQAETVVPQPPQPAPEQPPQASGEQPGMHAQHAAPAVEFDTVISASGVLNVIPSVQRIRMGAARAGQRARVWANDTDIHIVVDGQLVKTTASHLSPADLATLRMRGARPAGPSPQPGTAALPAAGAPFEVERTVDVHGGTNLAGHRLKIGRDLVGTQVTLRFDAGLVHVIADAKVVKTLPTPWLAGQRVRVNGSRLVTAELPPAAVGPVSVQRRVPDDGVVMVTRQRLRVGRAHAGKTVTIFVEDTHFRVVYEGQELAIHPRKEQRQVARWRAHASQRHVETA